MPGGFYDKNAGLQSGQSITVAGITMSGNIDLGINNKITFDADKNTWMRATADDSLDTAFAGTVRMNLSASGLQLNQTTMPVYLASGGELRWGTPGGTAGIGSSVTGVVKSICNGTQGDFGATLSALTAGTMTYTNNSLLRSVWHRFDWTNAMVTALGASTAGDIAVCTLPAKTVVSNAYLVIKTAETALTSLTGAIGRTGATYIDYIVASNMKSAANTVYGDASAERGTNLTSYDLPSYTGTTVVNFHLISGVENLSTAVASTGTVFLETVTLP